jgi:hypothetical protein
VGLMKKIGDEDRAMFLLSSLDLRDGYLRDAAEDER